MALVNTCVRCGTTNPNKIYCIAYVRGYPEYKSHHEWRPMKPLLQEESNGVNHPPHYNRHPSGVECIDVVEWFGFNIGNAIKYLWRADEKDAPITDLKKAAWYIDREIQRRERVGNGTAE